MSTMFACVFDERVRRGATEVLDVRCPGWADRIDLAALDVRSGYYCPLAQAAGTTYDDVVLRLGLSFDAAVVMGFIEAEPQEASALNAAWTRLVTQRRSAQPS